MIGDKKIQFTAIEEEYVDVWPHPKPAGHFIPDDYKKLERHRDKNLHHPTVKTCIPFLDAMTAGYIIPFDQDYIIDSVADDFSIIAANKEPEPSDSFHSHEQLPKGLKQGKTNAGKWINKWLIKTPPGYSCLFMQPMNRAEKRFQIIAGIVDTDNYMNVINFPFYWHIWDSQTVVKKGEPMVQIIPFKRESWKKWSGFRFEKDHQVTLNKLRSKFTDRYKQMFWKKKNYR